MAWFSESKEPEDVLAHTPAHPYIPGTGSSLARGQAGRAGDNPETGQEQRRPIVGPVDAAIIVECFPLAIDLE